MAITDEGPPNKGVAFVAKHRHFSVDLTTPDWSHTLWDEAIVQSYDSKIRPLLSIATRCRVYPADPAKSAGAQVSARPSPRPKRRAVELDLSNFAAVADSESWLGMLRGSARAVIEVPRESLRAGEFLASTWRPTWVDNLAKILGGSVLRTALRATEGAATIAVIPYTTAYALSLAIIAPAPTAVELFRTAWVRAQREDPEIARLAARVLSPFDALLEAVVFFNQVLDAADPSDLLEAALKSAFGSGSNATLMARGLGAAELVAGLAGRASPRLSDKQRKWIEHHRSEATAFVPLAKSVAKAAIERHTFADMWPALPERALALEAGIANLVERLSSVTATTTA